MDPIHGLAGALSALVIWVLLSSVVAGKDPYLDFTCVASKALIPTASSTSKALIPTASSTSKAFIRTASSASQILIPTASSASQILIEVYTPLKNATLAIGGNPGNSTQADKVGPYVCSLEKENLEATTTVILSSENASLYPSRVTLTFDPAEKIEVQMVSRDACEGANACKHRWRAVGSAFKYSNDAILSLDDGLNETSIVFRNFFNGSKPRTGYVQVLVRECSSGFWHPEDCSIECPICLNGGMCHPRSGKCICPPGFSGPECQNVHGRNIFGQDGQYNCSASSDPHDKGCIGKLFCLPEPFGCTCAAGYRGINCSEGCGNGTYGANCEGVCHCKDNSTCLADTGECDASSCQDGWFGTNCQDRGPVLYKELKELEINQTTNITCILRNVKNPNDSDIVLILPNGTAIEANYFIEYETPVMADYIFVVVTHEVDNEYTCAYNNITLQTEANNITFQTEANLVASVQGPTLNEKLTEVNINETTNVTCILGNVKNPNDSDIMLILPNGMTIEADYIMEDEIPTKTEFIFVVVANASQNEFTCTYANMTLQKAFHLTAFEPPYLTNPPTINSSKVNEITISWTPWETQPGDKGDPPVVNYIITYKDANETNATTAGMTQGNTTFYTVVGLIEDTAYEFRVTAVRPGVGGAGPPSPPAHGNTTCRVPGPPEILAPEIQDSALIFKWNPPVCEVRNGKILGYHYQLYSGRNITAEGVTTPAKHHTFDNLLPCTKYGFRVRGRTSAGNGSFSQIQNVTTPGAVPDEVTDIQVSSNSATTLHVSWSAPTNPPCPITNYSVTYILVQRGQCEELEDVKTNTIAVSDTKTALEMLHPDSEYVVVVRANTLTGSGNGVNNTGRTLEDAPGRPVVIRNTTKSSRSVTFTWQPPECRERNGAITGYTYKLVNTTSGNKLTETSVSPNVTSASIDGLTPCTKYHFKVRASTSVGNSSFSDTVYVTTDGEAPDAVGDLQTEPLLATSIHLNWTKPKNTSCDIISYKVTYKLIKVLQCIEEENTDIQEPAVMPPSTQHTIYHLLPASKYMVSVNAETEGGLGEETMEEVITLESIPGIPVAINNTLTSSRSVTFTWQPPACRERNGTITGYTYKLVHTANDDKLTETSMSPNVTSATFHGLTACTKYRFKVRAHTSVGYSPFSDAVYVTTDGEVPDVVSNVQVSSTSDSIQVIWEPPTKVSCDITNYLISYKLIRYHQCSEIDQKSREHSVMVGNARRVYTIPELSAASDYLVSVRANTTSGLGDVVSMNVSTPESAPESVTNVTLTDVGPFKASFSWSPPMCEDTHGRITLYSYNLAISDTKTITGNLTDEVISFEMLTPCTFYGFTVAAWTSAGMGHQSKPLNFTANVTVGDLQTEPLATAIRLSWTQPKVASCNITSHKVTYKLIKVLQCFEEENTDIWEFTVMPTSTQRTIFGLFPASKYMVSVKAETEGGLGEERREEVITLESAPGRPVAIRNTTKSSRSVTFTWQPPACRERNGAITGYTYKLVHTTSGNKLTESSVSPDVTSASIDGLTPCTKYRFIVLASTSVGNSSFSDAVTVTTDREAPDAVGDLQTLPLASSIHLSWTQPKNTSCVIISYKVTYKLIKVLQCLEEENIDIQELTVTPPSTQRTIFGLFPASKYMVSVKAKAEGGLGEERMEEVITLKSVPGKPIAIRKTLTSSRSVTFTWQPPACTERNGAITGYTYKFVHTTSGNKLTESSVSPNVTSASINGLTPCTKYHFKVRASTSAGYSSFSGAVYVTTDGEVPDVVFNMQASSTSDSIQVIWEPPTKVSCDINNYLISYKLIRYHQCSEIDQKSREHSVMVGNAKRVYTIPELSAASDYLVSVRANTTSGLGDVVNMNVSMPESVPSAPPEDISLVDRGPNHLKFTWQPPICGQQNGLIVSYTYTLASNNETVENTTMATEAFLKDLIPFVEYDFTLQANTKKGSGPLGQLFIETAEGVPSPPRNFRAVRFETTRLEYTWDPPDPPTGIISAYRFMYWLSGLDENSAVTVDNVVATNPVHSYFLEGLKPYTVYNIKIRGKTGAGFGAWSETLTNRTAEGAPEQPTSVAVADRTTTTLSIQWNSPENINGILKGYKMEYRIVDQPFAVSSSGSDPTKVSISSDASSYTLEDLDVATGYEIKLAAMTVKHGEYSTLTPIYTKIPVIAKPKMLDAPSVGDDNMVTLQLEAMDSPYVSVYQVTIAKVKSESTISRREVGESTLGSYQQSQDEYITAEFNKTALPSKFQVGDNKTYNRYYNAPLDPRTSYRIQFCGVGKTKQDTYWSCTEPLAVKNGDQTRQTIPVALHYLT